MTSFYADSFYRSSWYARRSGSFYGDRPGHFFGGALDVGPTLPDGAIGEWYFDAYQATPRRAVPNAAVATPVSTNLASAPRRQFNNAVFYTKTTTTVVDEDDDGPDGLPYAASLVGTGNWSLAKVITLPAGTFTFALDYKRNTGTDQPFRHGISGTLVAKTATSAWQTYTQTLVSAGGSTNYFLALSSDGTTGGEILIDNFRIYPGASDLGAQPLDSHIYLGRDHYETQPVAATGGIDTSVQTGVFLTQFEEAQVLDSCTFFVVSRKTTFTGMSAFHPVLANIASHNDFAILFDAFTGGVNWYMEGATMLSHTGQTIYTPDRLFDPVDPAFQVRAYRYDGTTASVWIDGIKYRATDVSGRNASIKDFWNLYAGTNFYAKAVYNALVLYDSALSDEDLLAATAYLKNRAEGIGLTVGVNRFICFEGDSLTNGSGAITGPYPWVFQPNSDPLAYGIKRAVGGAMLTNNSGNSLTERAASVNALLPADKAGRTFIYSFLIGKNDHTVPGIAADPTQFAADVGAFALSQKAAGWDKIVMGTLNPSTAANFNTWRNTVNGIWTGAGWAAAHGVDAIADFAADADIGPDAAAADTDWYLDGTHPTDDAIEIMAEIFEAAVNGL